MAGEVIEAALAAISAQRAFNRVLLRQASPLNYRGGSWRPRAVLDEACAMREDSCTAMKKYERAGASPQMRPSRDAKSPSPGLRARR